MRLDEGAKRLFPRFSRARIRKAIDWGGVRVRGSVVRVASRPLREGDEVTLAVTDREPLVDWSVGESEVLYEDGEYLAVNKPAGVYSQRTPYQLKGTAEHAVGLYLKRSGTADTPRVVHRLDRGTSGVMFFPKSRSAAAHIGDLLAGGGVEKVYWVLVPGSPGNLPRTVDAPVAPMGKSRFGVGPGGRDARTVLRVLSAGGGAALLEARPLTGRTHQVRVHLAHCGLPVLGDERYGGEPCPRMMLHCRRMSFPAADGRPVSASAPVDAGFARECDRRGLVPGGDL